MYFDNCHTIEELNKAKEEHISAINREYELKAKEIMLSIEKEESKSLIKKARTYVDNTTVFMAYALRQERGKRNEIIFHADGTVTI